ncbi:Hsp20/alpha crystallin family protein [Halalkalibacterium halodurans]|jgi:HSP20 family protein|uniref:Small heat shock protein n=2 Tax=Halalkalibacterium halodurans TaxID=86665 RepID=Q9KFJ9_HALH5|nr:Hsp20/alpha crystallin family protein [Halalkalibacterium halodurans]MDY7220978.1 Hsp20/alpha crystallin family protein [Halalkalibacterium halodurans]MDY7240217.1 Hsp20/alpha crystallin family protein [Halalkalibacterium halodurans]MED3647642.1 Hsp20/alpha crystallin family protein [Halalkalibacterium halodurans]MED4079868.1 Hsp20/alpha crystallin family protein [Halalkalibacterium halodurans]MED4085313.1 Hsp20/alpha crystallin family protein [Halalkalibacterium halodurans]
MSLTPYEPFRHLDQMRREFDRFFPDFPIDLPNRHLTLSPKMDVHETDHEVILECDIPGLESKEDLQIDVEPRSVRIEGRIKRSKEVHDERFYRREREIGHFRRVVPLPAEVAEDDIRAAYRNGVLEVRMRKRLDDRRRTIDVEFH